MIKNLIFDFGKVLVDYDFDLFFSKIISDKDRLIEFCKILNNQEMAEKMDRGAMSVEEIIAELKQNHPDFTEEIQLFADRYTDIVTGEVPGMKALLTKLKKDGFKLYGLSNWCNKVYQTIEEYKDIFGLLDGFIISSDVHLLKPEPEIYQRLFEKYNLSPSECVFADDKIENIVGSENVGMKAIHFKNAKQYEEELLNIIN